MSLYQLTLFYRSVKENQGVIRELQREIRLVSGNNFRVLSAGEQVCAIGFVSGVSPKQLRDRLQFAKSDSLEFLLVEIGSVIDTYLTSGANDWLAKAIYQKTPQTPPR